MVRFLEKVASPFWPTMLVRGAEYHHDEAAKHWCRYYFFQFLFMVQNLWRGPTVGSPWNSSAPPLLGRGRVAPPSNRSTVVKRCSKGIGFKII